MKKLVIALCGLIVTSGLSVAQDRSSESGPATIVVRYVDGAEVTVTDWAFLYTYQYDVSSRYYDNAKVKSRVLYLDLGEKTERGITEHFERALAASDIASMIFVWTPPKGKDPYPDLDKLAVRLSSGEEILAPKRFAGDWPHLDPALRIIPGGDKSARNGTIFLVGTVVRDDRKLDFEIQLGSARGSGWSPSERLAEIRFR
jgi:hypothetical protein